MTAPTPETAPQQTPRTVAALDHWAEAVTPPQRARLAAARAAALAMTADQSRYPHRPRWLAPALAASLLLALGLGFWPHPVGPVAANAAVAQEEQQQDEDLDLLLWMNSDDAS
jgi:ferric-dicitrate binding protein FerR (iron transport regulator)